MIYFSELKGRKVLTEDGIQIGILDDLIFLANERPTVSKLIVKASTNSLQIPTEYLKRINGSLIIRKDYQTADLIENELFLVKNLLDKQIIDLQDNKVVRVNDIMLQEKDGFYIVGVDTSMIGILRWFKMDSIISKFGKALKFNLASNMLSWADIQPLELTRGQVKLRKEENKLQKLHPEDLADYLEKTNIVNVKKILKMLDDKFASDVIGNLNINYQTALFKQFSPEKAAKIISSIDSDEAVDILLTLSPKKRDQILHELSEAKGSEIKKLLVLSKSSVGELISTEYLAIKSDETVRNVLKKIREQTADYTYFSAIYVLNQNNQLIGVFSVHELLLQDLETPAYKFMTQNMIVIHLSTPKEIAFKKMLKYKLANLPVIDENKQLLGVITIDDLSHLFSTVN